MAAKQVIVPASLVPMLLVDRGLVTNQVAVPAALFLEETTAGGGTAPGATTTAFVVVMG